MGIIGSATGRNEAVRCEYISPILYASIYIAKRITEKGITMDPQFEVVGDEASGRVDYTIKKVIDVVNEELIAITEGKQKDLVAGFMQNISNSKALTIQTREKGKHPWHSMISLTISMGS